MDRFHQLRVYVAVVEEQGFQAAARRLNLSPPAVTRAVAALEAALGIKLLNRTTRHVRTTEVGLHYFDDARRILNELEQADEAAVGINAEPQGHLVVTAPTLFGRNFVLDCIVEYLQRYPKMQVDALFLDRMVNMLEEGVDVGVRIGDLPDSTLRARKVGSVRLVLCASPAYLKKAGLPQHPEELKAHSLIVSKAASSMYDWRFTHGDKNQTTIKIPQLAPRLTVTTNDAAIHAAKQGFGITRVLSYQIADELARGQLKILLENFEPSPRPVNIIHREGRYASPKVRVFMDLLAEKLSVLGILN
ncbi:LysR family transcriptional regulator [Bowmanella dokdonensis]|uniref:LysR family transcriptional regulator n=1 Tax=Bowmanella dokdonensis TaxID=751969 RepID=A0A939DP40_9ALTE|nr:LysR family transcriptional regulator [Bowmanella dokdonensis]MBN7826149.1 LysR family transcriptional regulator [Bowmanella dokdonensis]